MTVVTLGTKLTFDEGNLGLRRDIGAALDAGARAFVVNASGVLAIDSYGVAELASSQTAVTRRGGRLIFSELSPKVAGVLAVTHLDRVFDIRASEAEALAAFAVPART